MSETFTVFRGESGRPYIVADRCAHRGMQLSAGWIEGECIRCFYHGWVYDGSGQCVEQPAETKSFASKVRISAYPAKEYLGLVFGFLGEGEAPEFPRYPEIELRFSGELRPHRQATVPCNYFQRIENAVDEAHLPFVHKTSFGGVTEIPEIEVAETEYGVLQIGRRPDGTVRNAHFHMPNINLITLPSEEDVTGWIPHIGWRVPVDDNHYVSFSVARVQPRSDRDKQNQGTTTAEVQRGTAEFDHPVDVARSILNGEMRIEDLSPSYPHGWRINVEDHVAQMGQGPIADRKNERLGRSDSGVILIRKIWAREMRALAEGRPLKIWKRPAQGLELLTGAVESGIVSHRKRSSRSEK